VGLEVLRLLRTGEYQERAARLGGALIERLRAEAPPAAVSEIRGKGLWVGIELTPVAAPARQVCERLMDVGVLAKDTHETTVRLAPPLCISAEDLDRATEQILTVLAARVASKERGSVVG
jgi:ornithine--oxo-acid transaminase